MTDEIKRGKFRSDEAEEREFITRSAAEIRKGGCDWCRWKDLLVMGDFDDNRCTGIVVARVIETLDS